MEKNRIVVNPLIEEHMDQMADGELVISQLTGHVTIKKGNFYISKTKEQNIETLVYGDLIKAISSSSFKDKDYSKNYYLENNYNLTYPYNPDDSENSFFIDKYNTISNSLNNFKTNINKLIDDSNELNEINISVLNALKSFTVDDIKKIEENNDIINLYYYVSLKQFIRTLLIYKQCLKIRSSEPYFKMFMKTSDINSPYQDRNRYSDAYRIYKINIPFSIEENGFIKKYNIFEYFDKLINITINNYTWKQAYIDIRNAYVNLFKNGGLNFEIGSDDSNFHVWGKYISMEETPYM